MKHHKPLANAEQVHSDRPFVSEIPKLRKLIGSMNLVGLANDTKWNELLTLMRKTNPKDWCPSFRFKCIDSEYVSKWDTEWWHHLPFPFISVHWFDLSFREEIHRGRLLEPEIIDHSKKIDKILSTIGFDYEKGKEIFRIFGYAPKNYREFK